MKRNLLKSLSVAIFSLGLCAFVSTDPADYNEYNTNRTGNDIALYDGSTFLYNDSLTQSCVFTYSEGPDNKEINNISFVFDNFSLRTWAEDDWAFRIRNITDKTLNITFYLSGDSEIISGNTALPPIYLEGDYDGENSGDINLYFTLPDTNCDHSASLTLGVGYATQNSVMAIEREGCRGVERLIDVRETSSGTENLLNVSVSSGSMNYVFDGWVHNYTEDDLRDSHPSTCQEPGSNTYYCPRCQNMVTVEQPLAPHTFEDDAYTEHTSATCTEGGYLVKQCSSCNNMIQVELEEPALGHDWLYLEGDEYYMAPTCEEDGFQTKVCRTCGINETEEFPALGHDYVRDPERSRVPTCTEMGSDCMVCSRCGDEIDEELMEDPDNHDWELVSTIKEPTCKEPGLGTFTCGWCGESQQMEIPNDDIEHTWGEWVVTTQADCSIGKDGEKRRTCTVCGEVETETIWGDHSYVETPLSTSTCTTQGSWAMVCAECGYYDTREVVYEELDPDNHEGEVVLVVDTPSTATTEGRGHLEWTCCHARVLNESGVEEPIIICKEGEHEWILDETITEPTCEQEGLGDYRCGVCGLTKRDVIPKSHLWNEVRFTEPTCITKGSWGMQCEICKEIDPEMVFYEDYDPENHEGVKKLVVDVAATTESEGRGHYEWSCCGAKELDERENVIYVTIPKLTKETSKDILSDIVVGVTEGEQPGEKSEAEEALDAASNETLLDIAVIVNQAFDAVANLSENTTTEEEKQAYVESIQAATESAVIAGSKLDNSADEAASITINLPERALPNFEEILRNFYSIQYDTILGRRTGRQNAPTTGGVTITGNIDYELEASKYRAAVDCINTTVDHMAGAAGLIRVCSNEKISTLVNDYIEQIGVRSFREFDKKKADLEFAEKAYEAILVNMQNQTVATLTESYENLSKSAEGTALDALTEEYNTQLAACKDIGQFEWLVVEIMRQKYNTFLNEQYFNNTITYEEYKARFIPEDEVSLVKFKDIYKEIFYKWALGDDAITYGYTEDYGITLQELTDTTIKTVSLKEKPIELSKAPTPAEITVAVVFGTLCLLTAGALVTLEVLKKKKGVVAA